MSALPPLDALWSIFGESTAATVTVPDGSPVSATVVWLPSAPARAAIGGGSPLDNLPRLACRVDAVPALPKLTRIEAPPLGGGDPVTWIVRGVLEVDGQVITAAVARSEAP